MLARAINMCCVFFLPFLPCYARLCHLHSFPTRRSSDLLAISMASGAVGDFVACALLVVDQVVGFFVTEVFGFLYVAAVYRSEEHTSELQSRPHLVCRLLLEKKNRPLPVFFRGYVLNILP